MKSNILSRRIFMKVGSSALAASCFTPYHVLAAPKKAGEVRVLFLAGDYWHNGMMYENHWRRILGVTGWRLMFAQSAQFVTPEVLDQTDLFVFVRWAGGDSIPFSSDGIVEKREGGAAWMTPEHEDSIVENVTKRGMGLIPMHCSLWSPNARKFLDLIGVKKPIMHGPLVNTLTYDFNPDHPVSAGLESYEDVDEIFGAEMLDVPYTPLFRAKQDFELLGHILDRPQYDFTEVERENFPLDRLAGWTREVGQGRVVVLNNGSYQTVFYRLSMKELMWRSAHWAMHMDIPESGLIGGRYGDRES